MFIVLLKTSPASIVQSTLKQENECITRSQYAVFTRRLLI